MEFVEGQTITEFLSGKKINDLLDGSIRFVVSGFNLGAGHVLFVGTVLKAAIGKGSVELLVEEEKEQGDRDPLVGETAGVAVAVPLDESVGFQLAKIVAKLTEAVLVARETEGGENSLVNLVDQPAIRVPPWSNTSKRRIIRVSWILMPGILAEPCLMMDVETLGLKPGDAIGDFQKLLTQGGQVVEALFEAEVRQVVAADFISQIG